MIGQVIREEDLENPLSEEEKALQKELLFASLRRLDVLSLALDDPEVTEVMVNRFDRIFIEKEGRLSEFPHRFLSEERLYDVVQRIAAEANRRVNESAPMMDAVLKDGSRVNIVLPPVSPDGAVITVRRFSAERPDLAALVGMETLSQEAADFLETGVICGYNCFISGGTGAGKTTLLSALASVIPEEERVVTVEDCAELKIRGHPNLVRLEARPASTEGAPEISIRSLIRNALRMRPDRLIVGEIRSGEAFDMLQAMNTGHEGALSTGHANSAADMLMRIESMVQMGETGLPLSAVRRQIASALDLLIHMDRLRDRSRRVTGIYEMRGIREGQFVLAPLYLFREEGEKDGKIIGRLFRTDETLENRAKLEKHGKRL
ncbi:MAG: CpaF family protein [Lachnospiraceae bacterium]|nr:CpaF family protein [Lachnospiraceae bacterium]